MNFITENKIVFALLGSAVLGVIAVILAALWLRSYEASDLTKIAVASKSLEAGKKIEGGDLKLVDWPKANLPVGSINDPGSVSGRVVRTPIAQNEVVLERSLISSGSNGSLSGQIASGMRAFTMNVNEIAGVAGFALPGNYVDVLINSKDNTNDHISKILLEKVLILAIAQETSMDSNKPKIVNAITLEVTPIDAEKLDLARSVGSLSLVLRNPSDNIRLVSNGVRKDDLMLQKTSSIQIKVGNKAPSIEVIRGISRN
jgi:pilus assembly protein CpaB